MICLFNSTTSKSDLIETNGDYILNMLCTSAIITEELNGEYSFDGIFRISNTFPKALYDMLAEENILKIDEEYGTEYFRIAKVVKTTKNVTVFARHITISDILTLWCEDVRPTKLNGSGAIAWIYDNAIGEKLLTVNSNIADTSTAYYVNKNVYEALFTADNSFLDRWGGEVYRRGFNLSINKNVGTDKGVTIRSKKNLTGFEATTTVDSLKTRIYPQGYNGITIDEKYIDSKYINNYARIYTSLEKFDDVKVNDENIDDGFATLSEAQEELKKRVQKMYKVNKVDLLTATYRINFVELGKTEEYKNYSILEQTWLGDTIEVIEDNLGINISVRVLKRKYDVLKKKRTETELSNKNIKEKPPTIQQIITEIEKIPSVDNILQMAKDNATALIKGGLKNSHVIVRENEIIIGDTKDINTMTSVWRWNKGGLGFSSTGYYGEFGTAITQDGAIVADFITTGILNANLIKAGVLKSFNQKTWINMEDGTFNFSDKVKFDGNNFEIDLSNEGLATGEDIEKIKAAIKVAQEEIILKVGKGEIISAINLTPENIKINASKINLQGYVTISNLKDGKTVISGDNIQTGTISAVDIYACTFRGKNMVYIEDNGTLSCDGTTYIRHLSVLETHPGWDSDVRGSFDCAPTANFNKEVRTKGEFWAANNTDTYLGVIRRGKYDSGIIQIDRMRVVNKKTNSSANNYLEIACYNSNHVFGADLWSSDIALKENIVSIEDDSNTELLNDDMPKTGLDLINSLNHYAFDYKETFGGGHVNCGYIAQELQELNSDLIMEIEQQDGTTLLQPKASNIIPNLSLAIKQQQEIIENQNNKINALEKQLANLEKLVKNILNK